MAFEIAITDDGYEWSCFQSSRGMVCGTAKTVEEAVVKLAIGEADLFEQSYPKTAIKAMLKNPKKTLKAEGWKIPPIVDKRGGA